MKGHKEKLKTAEEYDVVCAPGIYKYLRRAGVKHSIKKQMSRRLRRFDRDELDMIQKDSI